MTTKKLQNFLKLAKNKAKKCDHRALHVSFVVKKNKVLACGTNSRKTNTFAEYFGYKYPSTHSELSAVKAAGRPQRPRQAAPDLTGTILVNVRVSRCGNHYMNSKPCVGCLALARSAGIRCIYFTDNLGKFSVIS